MTPIQEMLCLSAVAQAVLPVTVLPSGLRSDRGHDQAIRGYLHDKAKAKRVAALSMYLCEERTRLSPDGEYDDDYAVEPIPARAVNRHRLSDEWEHPDRVWTLRLHHTPYGDADACFTPREIGMKAGRR